MRRITILAAGAALALAAPAAADTRSAARHYEAAYLALSAVDLAETIHCLERHQCAEGNPLFGRHPSTAKLVAGKVALGALHFALFTRLNQRNPRAALRMAQVSCVAQGGVVALNLRFVF